MIDSSSKMKYSLYRPIAWKKLNQELMSAKEHTTAHHNAQRLSQKYLDHHFLIRKMVVFAISDLPPSMYMAIQQDHRGYSPAS